MPISAVGMTIDPVRATCVNAMPMFNFGKSVTGQLCAQAVLGAASQRFLGPWRRLPLHQRTLGDIYTLLRDDYNELLAQLYKEIDK